VQALLAGTLAGRGVIQPAEDLGDLALSVRAKLADLGLALAVG
jgi:hypothetical protein